MDLIKPLDALECGCDEAGRGPLAGPVVAACVILPKDFFDKHLNDSKKLSPSKREYLKKIIEKEAIAYSIAMASVKIIDKINILHASMYAMHKALEKLTITPSMLLIDGHFFKPFLKIPFSCQIKGDARFMSIAAASILAKTYRDKYMKNLHQSFPLYHWDKNKGYPTFFHKEAIKNHGITIHHRTSFNLFGLSNKISKKTTILP